LTLRTELKFSIRTMVVLNLKLSNQLKSSQIKSERELRSHSIHTSTCNLTQFRSARTFTPISGIRMSLSPFISLNQFPRFLMQRSLRRLEM